MRKVKVFADYIEIFDDGILKERLPKITDEYPTVELMLDSLQPLPDKVVPGDIPNEVSMRQARLALLQFGLLDTVNTLIQTMPGITGDAARIEWEYAVSVKRDSQLVHDVIPYLGLDEDELDALFSLAGSIPA